MLASTLSGRVLIWVTNGYRNTCSGARLGPLQIPTGYPSAPSQEVDPSNLLKPMVLSCSIWVPTPDQLLGIPRSRSEGYVLCHWWSNVTWNVYSGGPMG